MSSAVLLMWTHTHTETHRYMYTFSGHICIRGHIFVPLFISNLFAILLVLHAWKFSLSISLAVFLNVNNFGIAILVFAWNVFFTFKKENSLFLFLGWAQTTRILCEGQRRLWVQASGNFAGDCSDLSQSGERWYILCSSTQWWALIYTKVVAPSCQDTAEGRPITTDGLWFFSIWGQD